MIKSELIQTIAQQNPHLRTEEVETVVNTVFEEITTALSEGRRVELRGFGTFSVKNRPAHSGRNPKTGEPVYIEPKSIPYFRMGKELKKRLNVARHQEEVSFHKPILGAIPV